MGWRPASRVIVIGAFLIGGGGLGIASAGAQGPGGGSYLPYAGPSGGFIPYTPGPGGGLGIMPGPARSMARPAPAGRSMAGAMPTGMGSPRRWIAPFGPIGGDGMLIRRAPGGMSGSTRPPVGSYPFRQPPSLLVPGTPSMSM